MKRIGLQETPAQRRGTRLLAFVMALAMLGGLLPGSALAVKEQADQYGAMEYFSKITSTYIPDDYYYTDQWFLGDAAQRNDSLALASAQLAASVTDDPRYGVRFLTDLGFRAAAKRFESTARDDCAYVMGTKSISDGSSSRTLVAVVFQGAEYGDKGWQQNVTVNGQTATRDHAAFSAAAQAFLADFDGLDLGGEVTLWITGQSRGGAVADLAAAYLLDRAAHPAVFGYTFESPAVTENETAHAEKYRCIHNYLSDDDPVPMLPLWGMTRYGQEVVYNTAAVEKVLAELVWRNAGADPFVQSYSTDAFPDGVGAHLRGLVAKLAAAVPTRADYTRQNTDRFSADGQNTVISYTYQGGLQALCHIVFGGETEADLTAVLMPLLDELSGLTYACLEEAYAAAKDPADKDALLRDAAQKRWSAAGALYGAVAGEGTVPFSQADLYALLKLLSSVLIDAGAAGEPDWTLPAYADFAEGSMYVQYLDLGSILSLAGNSATLLFSHYPDVILARLHLLAPAPAMEDVALTIQPPKAGDQATAAPEQIRTEVSDLGRDWLTVSEAKWLTDDAVLQNGKVYYLSATLAAAGHTLPEDFRFTVNGQAPVDQTVANQDGATCVTGVWTYAVGTPAQVSVTFDVNGHGTAPAALSVANGALLKYALEPADLGIVRDEQGTWRFDGWTDESGAPWDTLAADGDVTLRANWRRVIDNVALTYAIPHVGDSGESLLAVSVPEGAPYAAREIELHDREYNSVTSVSGTDELTLSVKIYAADDDVIFLAEGTEDDQTYLGTATVNGEEFTDSYYSDFIEWVDADTQVRQCYLALDYTFTPLPRGSSGPGGGGSPGGESGFVDVPADAYYADAVKWAVEKGVAAGLDAAHFGPGASCTRAQMATFLWRAAGRPEPAASANPFADVAPDAYYCKAVLWAAEKGITMGTDATHFSPKSTVSRGEAVTFLYRMAGEKTGGANPFADVKEGAYYCDAVLWAASAGVTAGKTDTLFAPGDDCARAQIVTFLYRALGQA